MNLIQLNGFVCFVLCIFLELGLGFGHWDGYESAYTWRRRNGDYPALA